MGANARQNTGARDISAAGSPGSPAASKTERDMAATYAAANYASVSNLVLKRDAATFTLKSGEIYFLAPVQGRVTGAVFIGEGELTLVPPTEVEKRSLQLFTDAPS